MQAFENIQSRISNFYNLNIFHENLKYINELVHTKTVIINKYF